MCRDEWLDSRRLFVRGAVLALVMVRYSHWSASGNAITIGMD